MPKKLPEKSAKQKRFLRALTCGLPVVKAAEVAGIKWGTLYAWRNGDQAFRAAWDDAVRQGEVARLARYDAELDRRALNGVEQPVFQGGRLVGHRREYSDPMLRYGQGLLREAYLGTGKARADAHLSRSDGKRVTVIVRHFNFPDLEDEDKADAGAGTGTGSGA